MAILHTIQDMFRERLAALHKGQGGAIAIMVLAALLIVFMISLVIYDTGKVARSKLEVQASAETAAWSHTAIEARSMNTIAFANIGKKIIIGMNSYYDALLKAYIALAAIVIVVIILCGIAAAFGADVCFSKSIELGVELAKIFAQEGTDLGKFYGSGVKTFFKEDLKALDNYQGYMASITPWWAWMEGFLRGSRNGGAAIGTFPVPRNITGQFMSRLGLGSLPAGVPQASNITDQLPARRVASVTTTSTNCGFLGLGCVFGSGSTSTSTDRSAAARQVCTRLGSSGDNIVNTVDYVVKTLDHNGINWKTLIIVLATGAGAILLAEGSCEGFFGGRYEDTAMPFEIPQPANATAWQLATSNLVFAYRPNPTLKRVDRDKFNFLKNDYGTDGLSALNLSKEATGSWGMARAEISFQENDTPDLWHTNWSSRMRPVALSGEWGSPTIGAAGMDALPYLAVGGSLSGIFSGGASTAFTDMAQDGLRFIMSMEALKGGRTAGLAR